MGKKEGKKMTQNNLNLRKNNQGLKKVEMLKGKILAKAQMRYLTFQEIPTHRGTKRNFLSAIRMLDKD